MKLTFSFSDLEGKHVSSAAVLRTSSRPSVRWERETNIDSLVDSITASLASSFAKSARLLVALGVLALSLATASVRAQPFFDT